MTRIDPRFLTDLNDEDHVMSINDNEWHTVGELRAAAHGELRTNMSQEDTMNDHQYTPAPSAYAADLARLRAAAGQTEYFRALDEQVEVIRAAAAKTTAANAAALRALGAVDLSEYKAPNPYAEGLRKLREGR